MRLCELVLTPARGVPSETEVCQAHRSGSKGVIWDEGGKIHISLFWPGVAQSLLVRRALEGHAKLVSGSLAWLSTLVSVRSEGHTALEARDRNVDDASARRMILHADDL